MRGINKVILFGNIGADPVIRTTSNGHVLAEVRLATNRACKENDEWVDRTEWHNVTLWNGRAELAEKYLRKGRGVGIEGRLTTDSWVDADGNKRRKTYVTGEKVYLMSGGRPLESVPELANAHEDAGEETAEEVIC